MSSTHEPVHEPIRELEPSNLLEPMNWTEQQLDPANPAHRQPNPADPERGGNPAHPDRRDRIPPQRVEDRMVLDNRESTSIPLWRRAGGRRYFIAGIVVLLAAGWFAAGAGLPQLAKTHFASSSKAGMMGEASPPTPSATAPGGTTSGPERSATAPPGAAVPCDAQTWPSLDPACVKGSASTSARAAKAAAPAVTAPTTAPPVRAIVTDRNRDGSSRTAPHAGAVGGSPAAANAPSTPAGPANGANQTSVAPAEPVRPAEPAPPATNAKQAEPSQQVDGGATDSARRQARDQRRQARERRRSESRSYAAHREKADPQSGQDDYASTNGVGWSAAPGEARGDEEQAEQPRRSARWRHADRHRERRDSGRDSGRDGNDDGDRELTRGDDDGSAARVAPGVGRYVIVPRFERDW
jgi:hypothetical protein